MFLGADAWDNSALLDNNEGAAADGSFFSSHFSPDTDEPTARAFVEAYRTRYGINRRRDCPPRRSLQKQPHRIATHHSAGATGYPTVWREPHASPTTTTLATRPSTVIMTIENGVKRFYQQEDP